jgi:hypothetical protein
METISTQNSLSMIPRWAWAVRCCHITHRSIQFCHQTRLDDLSVNFCQIISICRCSNEISTFLARNFHFTFGVAPIYSRKSLVQLPLFFTYWENCSRWGRPMPRFESWDIHAETEMSGVRRGSTARVGSIAQYWAPESWKIEWSWESRFWLPSLTKVITSDDIYQNEELKTIVIEISRSWNELKLMLWNLWLVLHQLKSWMWSGFSGELKPETCGHTGSERESGVSMTVTVGSFGMGWNRFRESVW